MMKMCVDFDGVCHLYSRGWQDGSIYDGPTAGLFEWLLETQQHFEIVIYSSRSKTPEGIEAMRWWFEYHFSAWMLAQNPRLGSDVRLDLTFAAEKPPAWLTIDDRAICFTGDWTALTVDRLRAFKPWNARSKDGE